MLLHAHARNVPAACAAVLVALTAQLTVAQDYNGDGVDDLAVGIPRYKAKSHVGAGAVLAIYGSPGGGLVISGNQLWSQASKRIGDQPSADDEFGSALASGDFDGDGFDDIAIAAVFEDQFTSGHVSFLIADSGGVHVIYGTPGRLRSQGDELLSHIAGPVHAARFFGRALAAGDFDGDGFDDLAIGNTVGGGTNGGTVRVHYGFANGLRLNAGDVWSQDSAGIKDVSENGDRFGSDLAAGDFNGDGRDDLAIGVPFEDLGLLTDSGAVNVLYGSDGGLRAANNQFWNQDSPGVQGAAEAGDLFGRGLVTGDFNNDGRADLAIGALMEDVEGAADAGAVHVLYGSAAGLKSGSDDLWGQHSSGIPGDPEANDVFGAALCAGDFNGDGNDDLAIGVRNEDVGAHVDAGTVHVLYGSGTGLRANGDQFFTQATPGLQGAPRPGNRFGANLYAGDFDGDGADDLAIGVPFEDVDGRLDAGALHVLYGTPAGLTTLGDQRFDQTTPGLKGARRADHQFGALACGGNPRQYGASLFSNPQPWIAALACALTATFMGMQMTGLRRR